MKTDFSIKWHLKVIPGQSFWGHCKADIFHDIPKIWRPKLQKKIVGSDHPTVVWGSLITEPTRISAWTLYLP